jgi:hypothetical protein
VRRLGLCSFGLVVACGAFQTGSEGPSGAAVTDGGTPGAEAGSSSGRPKPVEDAGPEFDATNPVPGSGPRVVQQKAVHRDANGSGGTLTVAFDADVAANDLVIVSIVDSKGTSTPVVDVEDNNGRQLNLAKQALNGLSPSAEVWWTMAPGGPTSVTIKAGATGTPLAVWILEAAGVSRLGDTQTASAQPASDGVAAAPLVSTPPSALVVSAIAHGGKVEGIVAGNDFTNLNIDTTDTTITYATAYRIVNEAASYGATWTAQSGVAFNACTVAFKP